MNLEAVMVEIAEKMSAFVGFNVFDYPVDSVTPPAGLLSYPEAIEYDTTYGNAVMGFNDLPLYLVTGRADSKEARNQIAKWVDPLGLNSVKAFLDRENYNSCDHVHVHSARFDTIAIAGIEYVVAIFRLDVTGEGV